MAKAKARVITVKQEKVNSIPPSTILSIIPAQPDWSVVYFDAEESSIWFDPIACFAMCSNYDSDINETVNFVGSMVASEHGLSIAEDMENYLGVSPPGNVDDDKEQYWIELAKDKFNLSEDDEESDDEEEPKQKPVSRRKSIR